MLAQITNGSIQSRDLVAELLADKRSKNTKRAYQNDLTDFFQRITGGNVTPALMQQFLSLPRYEAVSVAFKYKASLIEQGLAEATINRRLAAVRSLVKRAKTVGLCEWDLSDVQGEKIVPYRDTTGVTVEQMNEILRIPNRETVKGKRDYAMLRAFWELALRRGELANINVEDFDPELLTIALLGKGRGTQKEIMSITTKTRDAILAWLATREEVRATDPLFGSLDRANKGHRLTGEGIRKFVMKMAAAAGIKKQMSPHRLRHSSITAALEATNGNVVMVQKLSRHSKIETVMVYEDRRTNQQKQVTDLLAGLA